MEKIKNKTNEYKQNYPVLITLTLLWLISEIAFFFLADSDTEDPIIRFIFIGIPLTFVYFGHKWAKWVASVFLFLNGLLSIAIMINNELLFLGINGIINLFFAFALHFSKNLRILFEENSNSLDTKNDVNQVKEQFDYPYLLTRVKASFIDGILLGLILIALLAITPNQENRSFIAIIFGVIVIFYEPILLSLYSATIGHQIMNIRVVNVVDGKNKINLFQGLLRILTKFLLGWLSFITIGFNSGHRAIHDFTSNSIVKKNKNSA